MSQKRTDAELFGQGQEVSTIVDRSQTGGILPVMGC